MPDYKPAIPAKVRDVVYYMTLAVAAASALISGLAAVWLPEAAPQILATTGAVTSVMGIIGGGLGVAYRPGAQGGAQGAAAPAAVAPAVVPAT